MGWASVRYRLILRPLSASVKDFAHFLRVRNKITCCIFGMKFVDHLASCLPEKCLPFRARKISKCIKRLIKSASSRDFQTSEVAEILNLVFLAVIPRVLQIEQMSNIESSELLFTDNK